MIDLLAWEADQAFTLYAILTTDGAEDGEVVYSQSTGVSDRNTRYRVLASRNLLFAGPDMGMGFRVLIDHRDHRLRKITRADLPAFLDADYKATDFDRALKGDL